MLLRTLWRSLAIVLFLACLGLLLQLIWQPLGLLERSRRQARENYGPWTWLCEEKRCVRREWFPTMPRTTLETCQWTCSPKTVPLWPFPTKHVELGNTSTTFLPSNVRLLIQGEQLHRATMALLKQTVEMLKWNFQRLQPEGIEAYGDDVPELKVMVRLASASQDPGYLTIDTDESYSLKVNRDGSLLVATIRAHNFFGARHGMETLSQLAWWNGETVCILDNVHIEDAPHFRHRGLMIDTARNFMSVDALMSTVDAMAANKLNVLHWHITDSNSFPLELRTHPRMAWYGAHSTREVYTMDDVARLSEHARLRGVRVVFEVDAPAHAGAGWGNLAVCTGVQPWARYCGQPPCGQLRPMDNRTFSVLQAIYSELLAATRTTDMVHLGGDEVSTECWISDRHSRDQRGNVMTSWGKFLRRAHAEMALASRGKVPPVSVVWSSELTARYLRLYFSPQSHVVQVWSGSASNDTQEIIAQGFRVILSHVNSWYLDCGHGNYRSSGPGPCQPVATWQTIYRHRPWLRYHRRWLPLVLGGEACLWSEKVDELTLDSRLWPRSAALAERLWSDPEVPPTYYKEEEDPFMQTVYLRLSHHRERLVARGVRAEALWPRFCHLNPGECF